MDIDFDKNPELMDQLTIDVMPCFAIYSAANAVTRFYRKTLDELGLTYPQYIVMMVLWETKGTTMKALSERLQLDSSTLTPLVKKLEERGLVHRSRSKKDERVLDIVPTPEGMAMRKTGCDAAIAMTVHSGETFETQAELRARLMNIRDGLDAA
ncbi:MAG TPA: MarR family transcriptional regulator [Rhizobiaceae bacterium]|nr:MarR family transcriptional regulator [Rhizobiaceae bacterium]